ncbi:MAG: 2Fe-2S iron-sulfur cluster binding domain-containing protein [Pseudonocardiaceae bacterium]|nr:2Fe-2S iron-sulfur cluster binding domain-containing protein [Pseudonocardiaceae bacterium]
MPAATVGAGRPRGLLASLTTPLLDVLTYPHGPDRYLEMLDPAWSTRQVRAEITDVCHRAPGTVTVLARPNRVWRGFSAGQHVQLSVDIEGARRSRCYSIVTSEQDRSGRLEFTVHAEPDGLVSNHLQQLRPGTVVGLSQAQGPFTLPSPRPEHVVLISGGSGITPVMSIARTLRDEDRGGSVTLLHYARTAADVAYREELDELAASGVRVLRSYTREGSGELSGHFCAEHLAGITDAPAWVSGPATLVEGVREHWSTAGLEAELTVEHFTPPAPAPIPDDGAPTGEVSFGDRAVSNSGAPLLEQAEVAGLELPYGCRRGICFSCTQRKTSGTVRYRTSGALSTEPDSDIQLCVTVPIGDVTIDL